MPFLLIKIVVGTNTITYIYNATGQKVSKIVNEATNVTQTNYLAGGFQYKNNVLQFFPHAEGYVKHEANNYSYVFNYTDHLGNVRVSYSDIDKNGSLGNELQYYCKPRVPSNCIEYFTSSILEENHYYPFGLKHSGYNMNNSQPNYQYKLNGKEWQDELGLNWTSMDCRNYDPAIGRFNVMDPLTELAPMHNPYRFGYNNPVYWKDPSGLIEFEYDKNGKATSFKTSNKDEIAAIMGFMKQNEGASAADLHTFVFEDMQSDNPTFMMDLQEVVVEGKSKKSESNTVDNANFFNDRIGDGADILGATNNRGGSFRLTNGNYNGNNFSPRYYGSNWTGGSTAGIKTYNVSKVLKKGSIVTTVVLGTIEVGQGVSQDYQNYQNTGYTNGKNTAVATAKVGAGIAVGWAAGAATEAAIGTAIPIPVVGTVVGAIVGGVAGYYASEAAGNLVEKAYE